MPLLGVVVCGAPLAVRAYDLVEQARRARWEVSLLSTESAAPWLKANSDVSAHVTGFQMPQQPRVRPDALVVCPLTFNSGNKWALGIADNRPMSLLCEALGIGFDDAMLAWPAGPRESDGVWAGHWYAGVEASTGFEQRSPAAGAPVPERLGPLLERCRPFYNALAPHRLSAGES